MSAALLITMSIRPKAPTVSLPPQVGRLRHVALHGKGLSPVRLEVGDGLRDRSSERAASVYGAGRNDDGGAASAEFVRELAAESAAGARHDSDFAGQVHRSSLG
jgi:hypothetical protein